MSIESDSIDLSVPHVGNTPPKWGLRILGFYIASVIVCAGLMILMWADTLIRDPHPEIWANLYHCLVASFDVLSLVLWIVVWKLFRRRSARFRSAFLALSLWDILIYGHVARPIIDALFMPTSVLEQLAMLTPFLELQNSESWVLFNILELPGLLTFGYVLLSKRLHLEFKEINA